MFFHGGKVKIMILMWQFWPNVYGWPRVSIVVLFRPMPWMQEDIDGG